MRLWPSCSEIMELLLSSYLIVQLTSVKFYKLIKDEKRDIIIFFLPWSSNTSTWPPSIKNEGFQLPTDLLLMTSVQLDTLIKFKEDF